MLKSLAFVLAVLGTLLMSGYSLGEISLVAISLIIACWLTLAGVTVVMGWPPAVIIVGTVAIAIGLILKVFGGDLRIR